MLFRSESWCKINKIDTDSKITKKFEISVDPNTETDLRTAVITISNDYLKKEIEITQQAATRFIIKNNSFEMDGNGGIITIELETSGDYEIVINNEEWISRVDLKTISKTEQFIIDKNQFTDSRSGTITFSMEDITETVHITQSGITVPAADKTGMEKDATELAKAMYLGWNLGNSLEATGSEIIWGNPKTTKEMIDAVKTSGINAIRIPCSWDKYLEDHETYKIKESWLYRVKEVVDYCIDNDIYTTINIHWDGGWLEENCTPNAKDSVVEKQRILWTQIATYFRDYDEHLIFAGTNEPNVENETQMAVLLEYEQVFIDAVRATGGRNVYRNLIVQGPSTDIDKTEKMMNNLPNDPTPNRLMVEVHYYTPWQFCLLEKDGEPVWEKITYFWGEKYKQYAIGNLSNRWRDECNEDYLIEQFTKMKTKFSDKNIPVILGEFNSMLRNIDEDDTQKIHEESRAYFLKTVVTQAKNCGMVPFLWDMGKYNMYVFDRLNNMTPDQTVLNALIEGANEGKYPF